ncbi:axonemal dynein light chain domain-containing protein 1 isoform X2 [Notolabrus celidotus]|uniref:axonemal dynein light chain domain-containing protein 1 isoform X2 n=1 Tax=Notolabrus celidotus TaxID=1203425 RepID=UPI00149050F8|nr:axonemal dynein light chain domain-containing protein 1 isoform X2 [Notolabrus celidotus]
MSESIRASSAPGSTRTEQDQDGTVVELNCQVPAEGKKTPLPPVNAQIIPDELMVSLSSTVCNKITLGHTAHHRHCKGCGIRRPDAVWHHPLGRKKYKYFLEQPTSVTGAGRDISFLCDAVITPKKLTPLPPVTDKSRIGDTQNMSISESLIPEEYHIVKNKGLRNLELYEDAFTVQLQDDEQRLRVFPSLKPSSRLEVVQLMRMMDDMLEKAGVDQQSEELNDVSQMEQLLELVQVEQNIYNVVFHELIRQVSVSCLERGELLAKLRQRYQSLFERIPQCLKALHTEAVAQRALDRRLTEEILHIKISMQELSVELSKIGEHDAFVSQQAELAHRQLAGAIDQTNTSADMVQGYHELYELQRGRLEAQLLQMTEERDYWSQLTFCLALKVISMKKLQLVSQLHISEQSWSKTAKHCSIYLTSKDTEDLDTIMKLSDYWTEQMTAFMAELKKTEHAQCEQITAIRRGIDKWLTFCTTKNKSPNPKYEKSSMEKILTDIKKWSYMLTLLCECYQGEKLLCSQQTLNQLTSVQERWLNMSLELFRRHPSPDGEAPEGQQALRELDKDLSELLKQLDTQVTGETGIHAQIRSLSRLMESWVAKLDAMTGRAEIMSASDWLKFQRALHDWQSLAEDALKNFPSSQSVDESDKDKDKPNIHEETETISVKAQEFITNLSSFADEENQRLSEEVTSVHLAQTRWMLDLLLVMVPDHSEDQNQVLEQLNRMNISVQTLDEDAKMLAERLDSFSKYISSSCKLIVEEQIQQNPHEAVGENEMNECTKLQRECTDWMETSKILLLGVKGGSIELSVKQADPASTADAIVSTSDNSRTLMNTESPAEPSANTETKQEPEAEQKEGELSVRESPVVKMIGYDGHITGRKLGQSSVHLNGTEELVVSPATDDAQRAFSDLTTVGLLQQDLYDSELRVQSTEQRALKAEEALQAALEKIQDLERQLQGRPSLEPELNEETKETPPPSSSPATPPAPLKKSTAEAKPSGSSKRTKKR